MLKNQTMQLRLSYFGKYTFRPETEILAHNLKIIIQVYAPKVMSLIRFVTSGYMYEPKLQLFWINIFMIVLL